jgi:hypothetical protein
MIPGQNTAAAASLPDGPASGCGHLAGLAPVTPLSDGCRDSRPAPAGAGPGSWSA